MQSLDELKYNLELSFEKNENDLVIVQKPNY